MQKDSPHRPPPPLRVLVVNGGLPASVALAEWLGGHAGLKVVGPMESLSAAIVTTATFRPDVVLLDFHRLPVSVGYALSLFKEFAPAPLVFVLTHDASETMRRRLREAHVDAVFNKTSELDALVQRLAALRRSPGEALP